MPHFDWQVRDHPFTGFRIVDLFPTWQNVRGGFLIIFIRRVNYGKQDECKLKMQQKGDEDHEDAVKQGVSELSVELLPVHVVAFLEQNQRQEKVE